ncbi:MAG: nucleoside phosphorylase [Spirochaetes bacterium]|nr:MAG: nucleoside phosphorylase [Spirochaetota bacterium]
MRNDIQPHLLVGSGDIAPYVLLPGDPGRVERIAQKLDSFKNIASNREYKSVTGEYSGSPVSVVSTGIGGPSTAIAVEELAVVGVKVIIRVGSCGGWLEEMEIGDLVVPLGIVRNEGTSVTYAPPNWPAVPDFEVYSALMDSARKANYGVHTGISICRDNFYVYSGTTDDYVAQWKKYRVIASEMEGATVLTVGRLRGLKAGCVFAVVNRTSDRDLEKDQGVREYAIQASSGSKGEAITGEERAILTALSAVRKLHSGMYR